MTKSGFWEKDVIQLFFFRAAREAHGGSQTRGQIGAIATTLHYSNSGSKLCLQTITQLTETPEP